MVWIGLHGVMFLFLFSDFYKAKYTNVRKSLKISSSSNGHAKLANGTNGTVHGKVHANGNGVVANGGNKGACMVSYNFTLLLC